MAVGVPSKDNKVVPYNGTSVKRPFTWYISVWEVCSRIMQFTPMASIELEGKHSV